MGWIQTGCYTRCRSKKAPHIVVTGHGDIAPWSQSGLIRPIENYVDFDSWPLSDLFENLVEISSYEGVIYGVPQDAESGHFCLDSTP